MDNKSSELGEKLIARAKQLLRDIREGRPVKQKMVRRMVVKGESVFVDETVIAPLVTPPREG